MKTHMQSYSSAMQMHVCITALCTYTISSDFALMLLVGQREITNNLLHHICESDQSATEHC